MVELPVKLTAAGSAVGTTLPALKVVAIVPLRTPPLVIVPFATPGPKLTAKLPLTCLQLLFGDCADVACPREHKQKVSMTATSVTSFLVFAFIVISPLFECGAKDQRWWNLSQRQFYDRRSTCFFK